MKIAALALAVLPTLAILSFVGVAAGNVGQSRPPMSQGKGVARDELYPDAESDEISGQSMDSSIGRCTDASWTAPPLAGERAQRRRYRCSVARIAYLARREGYADTSVFLNRGDELDGALELIGVRGDSNRLPIAMARFGTGRFMPVQGYCALELNPPPDGLPRDGLEGAQALADSGYYRRPPPRSGVSCEIRDLGGAVIASVTMNAVNGHRRGGQLTFARQIRLPQRSLWSLGEMVPRGGIEPPTP